MTKNEYRKRFHRAIRFAPQKIRQEILADFDAILQEPNINENTLLEQLGSPQELAQKYLEDTDVSAPKVQRLLFFARNLVVILGILSFSIITIVIAVLYYYATYREFEYSDQALAASHTDYALEYTFTVNANTPITTLQASLVVYGHDKKDALLRCLAPLKEPQFRKVEHNACLLFLPIGTEANIVSQLTNLTLIQPKVNLQIKADNSTLQLYAKDQDYRMEIHAKEIISDAFTSVDNAPYSLKFDLYHVNLTHYKPS